MKESKEEQRNRRERKINENKSISGMKEEDEYRRRERK